MPTKHRFLMIGQLIKSSQGAYMQPVSVYQPSKDVADLTALVKKDYQDGYDILHRPVVELNNYSVVDRANKDQRTFNSFVDEEVEDPEDAWKWRGTRSMARNKVMAMQAHLTAQYILPAVQAVDDDNNDAKDLADVMRDVLEWMSINSNYRNSFMLVGQGMLVNPVTYLEGDYFETYQDVLEKTNEGYTRKQVLDEVLSGFHANVLSSDQVYITNMYEQDIQRQRAISKVRWIEYSEAKAKYGDHENFTYLKPGVNVVFNEEDAMFYELKDDDHHSLVQEVTWFNRREDCEVCFLGGIYFGNSNIDWNPFKHRNNRNAPKLNITPFGYERTGEHYFFYKSLVNRVGWDNQLIDAMYEMVMNREFLDLEAPMAFSGASGDVNSSVIFPGAQVIDASPDFSAKPILPPSSGNGYRALREIEDSMSEASVPDTEMGQVAEGGDVKAAAIQKASRSAAILLSGVKKTLGESIRQFGDIMADIALQNMTVAQVDEITGNLNYPVFVLSEQTVNGRKVSKKIMFDTSLMGRDMSEEERGEKSMELLEKTGYPDHKEALYKVNPYLFARAKYLIHIEPEAMEFRNKEFRQAVAERMYSLFRNEPLLAQDPEAFVREVMEPFFGSKIDEILPRQIMNMQTDQKQKAPVLPTQSKEATGAY